MKCVICGKIADPDCKDIYSWAQTDHGEFLCSVECLEQYNQIPFSLKQQLAPCGYEAKGRDIGRLVDEKQRQYGDSFHKCGAYLKLLYPDGIKPAQYGDLLALVRDFDKSMRIATGNQGGEDAWQDKAGYALLAMRTEHKENSGPEMGFS
jgi:hypothetical protein